MLSVELRHLHARVQQLSLEEGERRKQKGKFQSVQARTYLFSRSLLAASTIMLEAMDEQGSVLKKLRRRQIDKMNALKGSRRR